jgi:hypothetical protein
LTAKPGQDYLGSIINSPFVFFPPPDLAGVGENPSPSRRIRPFPKRVIRLLRRPAMAGLLTMMTKDFLLPLLNYRSLKIIRHKKRGLSFARLLAGALVRMLENPACRRDSLLEIA